jgi:hypothetical protein
MLTNQPPSRRQLLAAVPGVALAVALPVIPAPDPYVVRAKEESDRDGWRANDPAHLACRKFIIALWATIEACKESFRLAPNCQCRPCLDLASFQTVAEMFVCSVEGEYLPGSGFPEHVERILSELKPSEKTLPGWRRVLAEERAKALPLR